MTEFIKYIGEYSELLKQCTVWDNSNQILAPVITNDGNVQDDYIYEFYCYISLISDLTVNYEIKFIEGKGKFRFKFPQKAADKKNKPRFQAFENKKLMFQICAGTKINCPIKSEDNNPDISFQIAAASEDPHETDLILIMDAKFKENPNANLPKSEVYKFIFISYNLYKLTSVPLIDIKFNRFKNLVGNCLLTNGQSYTDITDIDLLSFHNIKEVQNFAPGLVHNVLG